MEQWRYLPNVAAVAVLGLFCITTASQVAAFGEAPKPKIDCRKQKNKSHPDCKNPQNPGTQNNVDAAYSAAYVLAKRGEFLLAQSVLRSVEASGDKRVLNYLGYTTRKLGNPESALVYYRRALEVDPSYAMARSYMGEAFVALEREADARGQLTAIAEICGATCDAYKALAQVLRDAGSFPG